MTNLEKYDRLFLAAFRVKPEELPGLKYRGIPLWDSLGHMDLMGDMEETFKISIGTADVLDFSSYEKGKEITGLENGQVPGAADVTVYHAGTAIKDGKLVTNGGRVLGVTATAATLPEALKKAYAAADCIHFDKLHRRSDIGARALAAMKAQEG